MKLLASLVLWGVAALRIAHTLREPKKRVWSWSLALALISLALTITALMYHQLFDALSPNFYGLVSHVTSALGLGFVGIWLTTLFYPSPSKLLSRALLTAATLVASAQVVLWLAADLHARELPDLSSARTSTPGLLVAYYMIYYAWCCAVLAATAGACARLAWPRAVRPAEVRFGLALISCAAALTTSALLFTAVRTWLSQSGHRSHQDRLRHISEALILPAVIGFPVGILIVATGPSLLARIRTRCALRSLEPLHTALVTQFPHIQLPPTRLISETPQARLARTLVEIHDGLDATTVHVPKPTEKAVVDAIQGNTEGGAYAASALLASAISETDEQVVLVALAKQMRHSQGTTR